MKITFFCPFLDPDSTDSIRVADSADLSASDLRRAIHREYETEFKRASVGVSDLKFFALPTPLSNKPYETLADRAIDGRVWHKDNRVANDEILFRHLEWQDGEQVSLFLQVKAGEKLYVEEIQDQVEDLDFVDQRSRWFHLNPEKPPSSEGSPFAFNYRQMDPDFAIYCGRPGDKVQAVPPTLLCPEFSRFVMDLDSCTPSTSDIECFHDLSHCMPEIFDGQVGRMLRLQEILHEHGFQDVEQQKDTTDGLRRRLISKVGEYATYLIVEGKNEIGGGSSEPMFRAMLYWMESLRELNSSLSKLQQEHTNFPVVLLFHYGPYISVAVGVFGNCPNVQILNPIIPLHFHPTDSKARATGERFICALRRLLSNLKEYYTGTFSQPRPDSQPQFPFYSTYTIDGASYRFVYKGQIPEKRVFVAHLKDNPKDRIYIKFVCRYGEDVHRAAFELGFAPKLRAVERFDDGWVMVVMDDVSRDYNMIQNVRWTRALRDAIDQALEALHKRGFVHGDVRLDNIMIRRNKLASGLYEILFVDFDWSGREGSVTYPSSINMVSFRRPVGVERGGPICAAHDKEMLGFILPDGILVG